MSDSALPNGAANGPESTGAPAPGTAPAPKPDDYEARVRNDPEFALDQVRKMKSENTKLFQRQQKYDPLLQVADQLGGADGARKFIYEYDAVLKHPEVAKVVEHYRANGVLPTANTRRPESDSKFDELFPDPQNEALESIRAEVSTLRQQVSRTQGAVGKQAVTAMVSQIKSEFPDGFDDFVLPAIRERIEEWEKTPQGRELLATLDVNSLKTIAGRAFYEHRDDIYQRMHERKLGDLKRNATGAPAQNLSTGRESAPKSSGYVSVREALAEFEKAEGPLIPRR